MKHKYIIRFKIKDDPVVHVKTFISETTLTREYIRAELFNKYHLFIKITCEAHVYEN